MTDRDERTDILKLVGTVGTHAPALVLKLGMSYLKMKRNARKASRTFVRELERGGMPSEMARRLGDEYGTEISLRKLISSGGGTILQGLRPR